MVQDIDVMLGSATTKKTHLPPSALLDACPVGTSFSSESVARTLDAGPDSYGSKRLMVGPFTLLDNYHLLRLLMGASSSFSYKMTPLSLHPQTQSLSQFLLQLGVHLECSLLHTSKLHHIHRYHEDQQTCMLYLKQNKHNVCLYSRNLWFTLIRVILVLYDSDTVPAC